MSRRRVPPMLSVAQIAEATGYTTDAARGLLRRNGLLERDGPRRWAVRRSRLRERLPDVFEDVYEFFELGGPAGAP